MGLLKGLSEITYVEHSASHLAYSRCSININCKFPFLISRIFDVQCEIGLNLPLSKDIPYFHLWTFLLLFVLFSKSWRSPGTKSDELNVFSYRHLAIIVLPFYLVPDGNFRALGILLPVLMYRFLFGTE